MESFFKDSKFIAAVLGSSGVAVGYFYRSRKERREGLKKALYQLLELWHRMSALVKFDFAVEFEIIHDELCRHAPETKLTPDQMDEVKRCFIPILRQNIESLALSDYGSFEEEFNAAVCVVSKDDPIFAYKMRSVSKSKNFLSALDDYLSQVMQTSQGNSQLQLIEKLSIKMNHKAKEEAVKDLERDIKSIGWRISIISYIRVSTIIYQRHKKLSNLLSTEFNSFIKNELVPLVNEFNKPQV